MILGIIALIIITTINGIIKIVKIQSEMIVARNIINSFEDYYSLGKLTNSKHVTDLSFYSNETIN